MTMEELHEKRGHYVKRVRDAVAGDLTKNGLELEAASLTQLDQTALEFFNPSNAFDAEGMTRLTEQIEHRKKQRNDVEQDTLIAIRNKNLEAEKLSLDIDRDYVTSFNFAVDQRGCTAESCCRDASWNPHWFVAAGGDKSHWRFEAAIPLDELTPVNPQRGSAWGLGVTRIIPAIGVESWTAPASASNAPENSGLLRFDGAGDPR